MHMKVEVVLGSFFFVYFCFVFCFFFLQASRLCLSVCMLVQTAGKGKISCNALIG